jgi:hypothetical protein
MAFLFDNLTCFNFERYFSSEELCLAFLQGMDCIPSGRINCVKTLNCAGLMMKSTDAHIKAGYYLRCNTCKERVNPLANSYFSCGKLTFRQYLEEIFAFVSRFTYTQGLEQCVHSPNTIVDHNFQFRLIAETVMMAESRKIGGLGCIVEVDETHGVTRKNNVGRLLHNQNEQVWLLGGICRETRESFLVRVPDRRESTIINVMAKYVDPNSFILTDMFPSYQNLRQHYPHHAWVNHSKNFLNPNDHTINTQKIENYFGKFKDKICCWGRKDQNDALQEQWIHSYAGKHIYWQSKLDHLSPGRRLECFLHDIARVYPGAGRRGLQLEDYDGYN